MTTSTVWLAAAWRSRPRRRARLAADRGEGVISVAIAVLIMAFLGAIMWVGFQGMWNTTNEKTNDQISKIGSDNP